MQVYMHPSVLSWRTRLDGCPVPFGLLRRGASVRWVWLVGVAGAPRVDPCDALPRPVPRRAQAGLSGADGAPAPTEVRKRTFDERDVRCSVDPAIARCIGTSYLGAYLIMSTQLRSPNLLPTPDQVAIVQRLFRVPPATGMSIDPARTFATVMPVKLRQLSSKLSRLDLTQADREVAALKRQFRQEDRALADAGKHDEIVMRNRRLMGLRDGARTRLVGFGGVRFE